MSKQCYDVAIIGGGPGGSTVGSLLRLYDPSMKVAVFERDRFPRDHVGESQLPATCRILQEMGAWDKVEEAGFPVKVGATYRWGKTTDLWDLDFLVGEQFFGERRPSRFEGQRKRTAFQVDRSLYDKILLDHAKELGCDVFESKKIVKVHKEGDRVTGLDVGPNSANDSGSSVERVEARYYVDASGDSGILRRAMEVETHSPTSLRNIAIWDYWSDAKWAASIGIEGTKAQIMSLGWGWIWFLTISATRTSVGLVIPAQKYKEMGKDTEEIYMEAIQSDPRIAVLLKSAKREKKLKATKDWSFVANRLIGENWFLVGDACGFADPILTAGMTLAHVAARKAAYTILELDRGQLDCDWLKREYDQGHRASIKQHIRFADFWYSANGCFTDLQEYCADIARDAGVQLTADAAFRWLGTGGFALETPGEARAFTYSLSSVKGIANHFTDDSASWAVGSNNRFRLNLEGASEEEIAVYHEGRIMPVVCYRRGGNTLALIGFYRVVFSLLQLHSDAKEIGNAMICFFLSHPKEYSNPERAAGSFIEALEALIAEGWVTAELDKSRPVLGVPEFEKPKHNAI